MAAATQVGHPVKRAAWLTVLAALAGIPAQAAEYYLIVGGLGGEARYETEFQDAVVSMEAAARRLTGDSSLVFVLSGPEATKEALEARLRALARVAGSSDTVTVFLVGHGSFDGEHYKFNLPGPDMTGDELAVLLDALVAGKQLVVNMTSASGAVLEDWQRDGRILITATRSGRERNATRFAQFWAQALSDEGADLDKNDVITAQEAFDYTERRVADSFEAAGALATEHPRLAGGRAGRITLARLGRLQTTPADSELERLLAARESLEDEIEQLKQRKHQLATEAYFEAFQELILRLAVIQSEIDRQLESSGGGDS